ncbi:MAG TPA: hypothetical protein P5083_02630 [Candidatus Paceibacterota bacterium]|nr:hypothetical protein [Candidatus Paceibacterota bacterium]
MKNKRQNIKNQKGQTLLITMLILMSAFLVGLDLAGLILHELKTNFFVGESVKALYASESGLEHELYKLNKGNISSPVMNNDTNFTIQYKTREGYKTIKSIGESNGTYRSLEVLY